MGDRASEEESGKGLREVGGREAHGSGVDHVAGMIERHDDHDGSAEGVDGLEPVGAGAGGMAMLYHCRRGGWRKPTHAMKPHEWGTRPRGVDCS